MTTFFINIATLNSHLISPLLGNHIATIATTTTSHYHGKQLYGTILMTTKLHGYQRRHDITLTAVS